jgi:hypothetical protein
MKIFLEIALVIALGNGVIACDVPSSAPKTPSDSIMVSL